MFTLTRRPGFGIQLPQMHTNLPSMKQPQPQNFLRSESGLRPRRL